MGPSTPDARPALVPSSVVVAMSDQEVVVGQEGVRQRRSEFTGHLQDKLREIYAGLDLGADIDHTEEDDHAKMDRVLDWATQRVQEVTSDAHDIDITHLPPGIKEVLKDINEDGDNRITIEELKAAAKAHTENKKRLIEAKDSVKFLRKAVFGLLGIVILLCAMMFGMSLLATNIAKDTGMGSQGGISVPAAGEESSNGVMTSKDGKGVVATAQTKIPMKLSSTLGDNQLAHLTMAAFSSDAGHSLHIHVHGFLRVPVVGSRCGNVIYLITQMGRIMLDDEDVSFEDDAAIAELNRMGFVISSGGIGRRLQGSAAAAGFFNMLEGSEDAFPCGSIDPPQLPTNYKATLVTYELCDQIATDAQQGAGKSLNCQSDFGGFRPGVIGLPENLFRLTLPDTRRSDKLSAVDITDFDLMERSHRLAWKTEEVVIDAPSYGLTIGEPPHHFGQKQMSLQDKVSTLVYSFQVADPIAGLFDPGRKYCSNSTNNRGSDESHLEYRGLWIEGDKSYRHWRLMKKTDAEIAFGGTLEPSDRASFLKNTSYEYFDEPETLTPFRLISPSGLFVEYHNYEAATDETVTEYLSQYNLALEDAIAPQCELQPPSDPNSTDSDLLLDDTPRIFRSLELDVSDAQVYKDKLAGLDRIPLNSASFEAYLQKVLDPFSVPNYCMKACGIGPERVSHTTGNNTCALKQEDAECLLTSSGFSSCKWSNLAQLALPCTNIATQDRRLGHTPTHGLVAQDRRLVSDSSCTAWFGSPTGRFQIGNFGFAVCYRGRSYQLSGYGSGCGWYGPIYICGRGDIAVAYNGRVDGKVTVSASVSIPRLATATLTASVQWKYHKMQIEVSGTVSVTNWVGGVQAVLRGTWNEAHRQFRLQAEVDVYFVYSSWYRYNTYNLLPA